MSEEKKGPAGLVAWVPKATMISINEAIEEGRKLFGLDRTGGINRTTLTVAERKAGKMDKDKEKQTPAPWRWIAVGVHNREAPHNYRNVPVKELPEDQDNASHYVLMGPTHDIEEHWTGNVIEDGSASGEYGGIDPRSPDAVLIESAPELQEKVGRTRELGDRILQAVVELRTELGMWGQNSRESGAILDALQAFANEMRR